MFEEFNARTITQPARSPEYGEAQLCDISKSLFSSRGIDRLYLHQAEGIKLAQQGANLVIVAPTASGKSEVYINSVIEKAQKGECSLVLYPTKALSRDQLKRFEPLALYGIRAEIYDGDTTQAKREKIRKSPPQIIITNFDMLHFMLLNNGLFDQFFSKLSLLVVDELHSYSGVFGGHAANIIWRLKRVLAKKHKRSLRFICTSATIGNAQSFARMLFGESFSEIKGEGSPAGGIEHILCAPEAESYTTASLRIAEKLEKKTLIFANSHSVAERLGLMGKRMGLNMAVYRAGLDQSKRQDIERYFKRGDIRILATTSALELGLDIGDVDAVVLAGFPGSITRVKQRIGRAGRKGQKAYGIYVARENPLDHYYYEKPDEYLNGEPESCFANPNNENLARIHLLSAAKDALLAEQETKGMEQELEYLVGSGYLKKLGKFYIPTPSGRALVRTLSIRGIGKNIRILDSDSGKQIGERGFPMAMSELFEGALYLHGGQPYLSEGLDMQHGTAQVRRVDGDVDYYTQALSTKQAEVIEESKSRSALGFPLSFGKVHITTSVYGFSVKETFSGRRMGEHSFDEPYVFDFDTYALWADFDGIVPDVGNFGEGLHGFEHVFIAMAPALTGADSKELGGLSYPSGRMYVYDGIPDGSGAASLVFDKFEHIAAMAAERLKKCACESGCPKCILDPLCGNDNRMLDKHAARKISDVFSKD